MKPKDHIKDPSFFRELPTSRKESSEKFGTIPKDQPATAWRLKG